MHIPPYDNRNAPIVDVDDAEVPLAYFNIVRMQHGQRFNSAIRVCQPCPTCGVRAEYFAT